MLGFRWKFHLLRARARIPVRTGRFGPCPPLPEGGAGGGEYSRSGRYVSVINQTLSRSGPCGPDWRETQSALEREMTGVVKSVGKYALLAGTALALSISVASAASLTKAGMDKRVADLEREVTLLKNQMKSAMMAKKGPGRQGRRVGHSRSRSACTARSTARSASRRLRAACRLSERSTTAQANSRFGIWSSGCPTQQERVGVGQ